MQKMCIYIQQENNVQNREFKPQMY